MRLTFDAYAHLVSLTSASELEALCLTSRALRTLALPHLYTDVRISSLQALVRLRDTLVGRTHDGIDVARYVRAFTEAVSQWHPNDNTCVPQTDWARYLDALLALVDAMTAVRRLALSITLDTAEPSELVPRLTAAVANMPNLRWLWLTDVCYDALAIVEACRNPLDALGLTPSHMEWTAVSRRLATKPAWKRRFALLLERHMHQLRMLEIDYSWHIPIEYTSYRFPHIEVLLPRTGSTASTSLLSGFPSLTHLKIGMWESDRGHLDHLDKLWPSLKHLDVEMWYPNILTKNHAVRTIVFHGNLPERHDRAVAHIGILASPKVKSLRLSWEWRSDWLELMEDALRLFPNLEYLNFPSFLDPGESDLMASFMPILPLVPPTIQVLELRFMMVPMDSVPPIRKITACIMLCRRYCPQLRVLGVEWMGFDAYDRNVTHWTCPPSDSEKPTLLSREEAEDLIKDYVYIQKWPKWPRQA